VKARLTDRVIAALVWIAAFAFAAGLFLSITMLMRWLPATDPVAVGRVTIERYSKLRDYLGAAIFFLLVPPATVWLHRWMARTAAALPTDSERLLFVVPFFLSPVFYLTTGKVGWVIALPLALAFAGPRMLDFWRTRRWMRALFRPEMRAYHALLFCEAVSWLFYRYLVTSRRIAHVPTLFLEVVFVAMFVAIFWAAAIVIARLAELSFARPLDETFRRLTVAGLPIVVLPFLATAWVKLPSPRTWMVATLLVCALLAMRVRPMKASAAWKLAAFAIVPALIYLFSFASTAHGTQWIDLFHRGESIGPASDYLRGKAPYRDVFALHGMLEDGLLDAWLMELFGRTLDVAIWRTVILGAFLGVAIWYLGLAVFGSMPLALLCVAMGSWTTAENNRTFFQVAVVALYWQALRKGSRAAAVFSGVFAGVALFFSYEIGLYSIVGAIAAAVLIAIASRRTPWSGSSPLRAAGFFLAGVMLGAAPFAIYLASRGALGEFVVTSFVTIPNIIDAVWSLPFPDLVTTFRKNLTLQTLAEFVLWEKFHLILSPLTIAAASVYFIQRWLRRRVDTFDYALLVMTVFALVAQRTAFGRVSFRHQYFAAFLIGPLLVLLAVLLIRRVRVMWAGGSEATRVFVASLAVASLPLLAVLFWIPDLVNARLHDFTRYWGRMLMVDHDARAQEVQWRIDDVAKTVRELTKRGEPIFDFSNQPAFYFFADRPNPTRFYQVPILSPARFQRETIVALERTKPKVVIRRSPELFDQFDGVTNDVRAQAVSAYLDDTYQFHKTVRGVEIWTRRSDARPRAIPAYLALVRVPEEEELVNSGLARMVFPAVGSVWGVGGSHWQSDLTIHNPFIDPLRLKLRYVTGQTGTDRHITLAPRQTLRWTEVVKTLFQSPDSIGTLWVEHREGRAPVAIVKTSDVAHHPRATLVEPLTARDAASWSGVAAELAIVGIPPPRGPGRRVNVGMVNIGTVPATFEVTARTRSGRKVGRAVASGVPEDQVWFVNDAESALGVTLDETMTVRIEVIAGTGVAFATAVEYGGDSEFIAAIPAQRQ
jgi:hypothetical protein